MCSAVANCQQVGIRVTSKSEVIVEDLDVWSWILMEHTWLSLQRERVVFVLLFRSGEMIVSSFLRII